VREEEREKRDRDVLEVVGVEVEVKSILQHAA
jgi:hypothetical protein